MLCFFFNDTATTEIYTLSLHDALPIFKPGDPFVHAFTFIIQFGAILSVVCLYWKRFFSINRTPVPELVAAEAWLSEDHSWLVNAKHSACNAFYWLRHRFGFYWLLVVGVLPAVVVEIGRAHV